MKNLLFKKSALALSVGFGLLATQSCQKEETTPVNTLSTTEATAQVEMADQLFFDMFQAQNNLVSRSSEDENGALITINEDASPKQLIADYGVGVVGADGKTRSGKITISYESDGLYTIGNKVDATFENYRINDNLTSGKIAIHNVGYDVNKHLAFKVILSATHNMPNGKVSIKSTNKVSVVEGFDTPRVFDDVLQVDGNTSGVLTSGEKFEISFPAPLVRKRSKECVNHYVSGISLTKIENQPDRYLDYGNGGCDNIATEIVNGVSKTITLD